MKFTWLKWGDLIVDVGREMYVPLQLSSGKLLYRDIFFIYGPFSPYFNAMLFKIFGVNLYFLYLSGFITLCATSVLIYKISRLFLNIFYSTFTVLTFLIVFAFGHYTYLGNYNFFLPYSYSSIHAIAFSLAALYFFYLWMRKKATGYAYLSSLFILLTYLSRLDIGAMLILSILIGVLFYTLSFRREQGHVRLSGRNMALCVIIPSVLAVLIYALFLMSSVVRDSNLFEIWVMSSDVRTAFAGWLSGIDDMPQNLSKILRNILHYSVLCFLFAAGGLAISLLNRKKSVLRIVFSVFIGLPVLAASFFLYKRFFVSYDLQYRSLPVICLATILISAIGAVRQKERTENISIFIISVFSLLLMSRMLLHVWAGHYGFYILVPALIVYHIFFLKIVAAPLKSAVAKRFFRAGFLLIFILFMVSHFRISNLCYSHRNLRFTSKRGSMNVFRNDREYRLAELMKFLDVYAKKGETLVVFPEGLVVNFMLEKENPLYYYSYHPVDLAKKGVSDEVIRGLEDEKVDYVVLTQRRTDKYGYAVFGKDYAQDIFKYVLDNYQLYKQFGPFPFTTKKYGTALFKRSN